MTRYQKIFRLAGFFTVALALGGCSSQSEPDAMPDSGKTPMTFGAVTSRALTTAETITDSPFSVWGNQTPVTGTGSGISVFDNEKVSYSGGVWSYTDTRYWFPGFIYNFLAIHPAPAQTPQYDPAAGVLKYTFDTSASRSTDLLYAAYRRKCVAADDPASTARVPFSFSHALSVLHIRIKADQSLADGTSVRIASATLHGIYGTATLELSTDTKGAPRLHWDLGGGNLSTDANPLASDNGGIILRPGEASEIFITDNTPLMLIPQTVGNNATLTLTYTIGDGAQKQAGVSLFAPSQRHGGVWSAGKSYSYTLTIQDNDHIIFSVPDIHDWEDSEGGNYII